MKAIDNKELIIALDELEKEKGIKKEYVLESIETALVTAYKRNFDVNSDNVKITLNKETGETHVYEELEVVENVEDDKTQISLEGARKLDSKLEIGDTVHKELMPKNFGRIAAQTAKQVIVQRIREASREIIFNEFSEKKGEIVMLEKMQELIADQLSVDADSITEASSFKDDLGADSLDVIQIIMGIEDAFDIEINNEDAEKITTVGDAVEQIKNAVN